MYCMAMFVSSPVGPCPFVTLIQGRGNRGVIWVTVDTPKIMKGYEGVSVTP